MTRFLLSPAAEADLKEIDSYLDRVPTAPAERIARGIFETILSLADAPYRGTPHSHLTLLCGREVRSRLTRPYRIFYTLTGSVPEVIAILHGARDTRAILTNRIS